MKKIAVMLTGGIIAFGALFGFVGFSSTLAKASDCGSNAVITCGFSTITQLRAKYNSDSPKGTQTIYTYFGISSNTINKATYKTGYVTKAGNVVVDGKTVATNAITAGREYIPGSTKHVISGTTFYTRTPATSFESSQLSVIAFFDAQGRFVGASIHDCGNPVMATNKVTPPPTPPPAPTPVYSCDKLVATKITRNEYSFTTSATAKDGAVIKSYSYNFGDGTTQAGGATIKHTYSKAGTYTVKSTVSVTVNGKVVVASGNCMVTVTVAPEMCTVPGKTQYPKDSPLCLEDKPSVSIEKTVNGKEHETVVVNTPFTYEIVVKNTGNVALKNSVVTDKAPANVVFLSAQTGVITNNAWSYTIPSLAIGQSTSFTISAKLTAYQSGTIVNTACVETPTVPGGNPDDCDTAEIDTTTSIEVCDTTTNTIIKIDEKDFDESHMTKDLTKCAKTELPPELPHTGAGTIIGGGLGLSAIAGAVNYYGASRRSLMKAMLKQ
ncbi:DUF11 domain-containing protein, partial [Microbacteriaceae bacterium]|nr:DUF11 domain-containing protein [Candidatus Saccharibacteria bacterium]